MTRKPTAHGKRNNRPMNHLLTATFAALFLQMVTPTAAAANAAPANASAAAPVDKLVVLDCLLRIRQQEFRPVSKEPRTWDERLQVEVNFAAPNVLVIEGKGLDFNVFVAYFDPLVKPTSTAVDESNESRWQIRRPGNPDLSVNNEEMISISRTTGRLEYNRLDTLQGRPWKTSSAVGTCTKKDTSKRLF